MGRRCDEPEAVSVRVVGDAVIRWAVLCFLGCQSGAWWREGERGDHAVSLSGQFTPIGAAALMLGHEKRG